MLYTFRIDPTISRETQFWPIWGGRVCSQHTVSGGRITKKARTSREKHTSPVRRVAGPCPTHSCRAAIERAPLHSDSGPKRAPLQLPLSRISVAFTPPISRSKAHPPFLSDRKQCARLARSAKITMAAPQNPPFQLFSASFASHRLKIARIAALFARVV